MYIAGDIYSGLVGNTFVHQCHSSYLSSFFESWPIALIQEHWLRIPPPSCNFLLRSVLPCAGPVQAIISDMLELYSSVGLVNCTVIGDEFKYGS